MIDSFIIYISNLLGPVALCLYVQNEQKIVKRKICNSWSLSLEFPVGTSYSVSRIESMICFSTSFNCCMVLVWFTNMNCASSLPENKLATSLQACKPSAHVWSVLELSLVPQFSNQAPPGAQQLGLPDFLMIAHLGHTGALLVAVTTGVDMQTLVK